MQPLLTITFISVNTFKLDFGQVPGKLILLIYIHIEADLTLSHVCKVVDHETEIETYDLQYFVQTRIGPVLTCQELQMFRCVNAPRGQCRGLAGFPRLPFHCISILSLSSPFIMAFFLFCNFFAKAYISIVSYKYKTPTYSMF